MSMEDRPDGGGDRVHLRHAIDRVQPPLCRVMRQDGRGLRVIGGQARADRVPADRRRGGRIRGCRRPSQMPSAFVGWKLS